MRNKHLYNSIMNDISKILKKSLYENSTTFNDIDLTPYLDKDGLLDIKRYEDLPQDQKDDGTQYIIYNGSVGSLPDPSEVTNYWIITPSKYASLSQSAQEDGTTYYISETATNVKGSRVINTSEEGFENLTLKEKRNNTPYYITNRRMI